MAQSQGKFFPSTNPVFDRLRHYQVSEGLTWKQVAENLQISVSTIMGVKAQKRNLGPKALFRLEEAEREAATRRSAAERVVESLLGNEGSALELLKTATCGKPGQGIPVEYIDSRRKRALPTIIKLVRPSEESCLRLRRVFAATLDSRITLLACLPPEHRAEAFVRLLKPETVLRLQSGSLEMVFGEEWRLQLAELALRDAPVPGD
jgi:hypothetical protein